jgi:hypothetical protein
VHRKGEGGERRMAIWLVVHGVGMGQTDSSNTGSVLTLGMKVIDSMGISVWTKASL